MSDDISKKLDEVLERGMPGGLRGELERWVNWRDEPAKICWLCGSPNTQVLDPTTRECKDCGAYYAVFKG